MLCQPCGSCLLPCRQQRCDALQGLARGAYLGRTAVVTDSMLMVAAETLPGLIAEEDVAAGLVYPQLKVRTAQDIYS